MTRTTARRLADGFERAEQLSTMRLPGPSCPCSITAAHISRGAPSQFKQKKTILNPVAHVVPATSERPDALLGEGLAACWVHALDHTPEDAHSDLLQQVVCACIVVVCNSVRRVQMLCSDFPRLLAWLTSVEQGIHIDFIGDICSSLCERMRSAPGTLDTLTTKVWTLLRDDLQHCAESCVVPAGLHAFIADLNSMWVVDSVGGGLTIC